MVLVTCAERGFMFGCSVLVTGHHYNTCNYVGGRVMAAPTLLGQCTRHTDLAHISREAAGSVWAAGLSDNG